MNRVSILLCMIFPLLLSARAWQIKIANDLNLKQAQEISRTGIPLPQSKTVNVKEGAVCHLSKISGKIKRGTKLRTIAFTVINSDTDTERHIGIGADWIFTCFINGKKVLSTEPGGNEFLRISPYNHIGKVKLKKGKNFVSLFIRPWVYQWKFAFKLMPELNMLPGDSGDRQRMIDQIFPPKNPGLLRKELLHQVSVDSAALTCEFGKPVICGIRYRESSAPANHSKLLWHTRSGKRRVCRIHRFTLNDLLPDTGYNYEIVTINTNTGKIVPVSSGSFKTFPAKGVDHSFIVTGDTQVSPDIRQAAVRNMLKLPGAKDASFFVSLGDVTGTFDNFETHYFDYFLNVLHQNRWFKPTVLVRGNHEYRGNDTEVYPDHFGRSYYAFRHGEVFYIVLDTGEGGNTIWKPGSHSLWTDTDQLFAEQSKWLEKIINTPECKNARYRIVIAHASPFKYHAKFYAGSIRKLTEKFFFGTSPRCKIDLWLCGHVHYVSRFDPATKTLVGFPFPKRQNSKIDAEDLADINFPVVTNDGPGQGGETLSVTTVKVSNAGLNVTISTPEGKIIDEAFIQKNKPHTVKRSVLQKL